MPEWYCIGLVSKKTLEQIKMCDAGSWFSPEYAGEQIPTLEEIFQRYGTSVNYYIETKNPDAAPGMEEELLRLMGEYGLIEPAAENCQVLIQSFSAESLMKIHELEPSLPLIQLYWAGSSKAIQSDLDAAIAYAVGIGPYKKDVDAALVEAAHERWLAVHPSTVNTVEEMEELIALGVDGMFTNNPDLLDGVLGDAALSSPRTRNTPPAQEGTICCLLWSNCRSWLGRSPWRLVCSDAQIGFAESSAESCPIASWLQHKPKPKAPRATRLSPS